MAEDNTAKIKWTKQVLGDQEWAKHINLKKHFDHLAPLAVQDGRIVLY